MTNFFNLKIYCGRGDRSKRYEIDNFIKNNFKQNQQKNWCLIQNNNDERFKKAIWCCEYNNYRDYAFHASAITSISKIIGFLSVFAAGFSPLFSPIPAPLNLMIAGLAPFVILLIGCAIDKLKDSFTYYNYMKDLNYQLEVSVPDLDHIPNNEL